MEAIAVKRSISGIDSNKIFDKSHIQDCERINLNKKDTIYAEDTIQKLREALSFVSKARNIIYKVYPYSNEIDENPSFIAAIRETEIHSSALIKAFSRAIGDLVAYGTNREFHNK